MIKTRTTTRTTGSAQRGPGSGFGFGTRCALLAPEDSGGSGGGGSSGGTTPPAETPPAGDTATPPGGTEKMVPQSEVNRLVGAARQEGRSAAAREQQKKDPPAPQPDKPVEGEALSMKQLKAQLDESEMRRVFDKRAAKLELDDDAADDLFALYRQQKPTDVGEWFETKAKRFGLKGTSTVTPPPAAGDPQTPPAAAPKPPNKVDLVTSGGLVDIFAMSDQQIRDTTPQQMRGHFEKILSVANDRSGAPPLPKAMQRK